MHRYMRKAYITVVAVGLVASAGTAADAAPTGGGGSASGPVVRLTTPGGGMAVVRRDDVGVPHVVASGYRSVAYGLGHTFATDNICTMEQIVLTVSGERSRWFGAETAPQPDLLAPFGTNLESDLYNRSVNQTGEVERLLHEPTPIGPSADARDLVRGYVEGFNRYLRDTGVDGISDPACRSAAWVRPLTELDIWRHVHTFGMQASAAFAPGMIAAAPPGATKRGGPTPSTLDRFTAAREAMAAGSNAVAVGKDASATGSAMVLANPHFPWLGNGRFYRMRLTVPGRLDAAGSAPFGVPVVGLGYNKSLTWTHTVSSAVPIVVHRLTLTPGDPTSYLVDGASRPMRTQRVVVPTGPQDGGDPVVRTLYRTEDGPLALLDADHRWSDTTAYAVQDMNEGSLRQIDAFFAESRARSVDELRSAHAEWQGNPFFTTIAADATGRVRFDSTTVVPHVTDEHAAKCVVPGDRPIFDATGLAILESSTSDCALGADADAVAPGIMGPARLPELVRTDWVSNSNDSPWLTNPADPLDYPRVVGDTGTTRSLRTRFGATVIDARLRDGGRVDAAELAAMVFDNVVFSATLTRDDVLAVCRAHSDVRLDGDVVDLRPACAVLRDWDDTANVDSRGAVLWQAIWQQLQSLPDGGWATPFDPTAPLSTPTGLRREDPAVPAAVAAAVRAMGELGIPVDVPTGAVQRVSLPAGDVPIHGCASQAGCYNSILTGSAIGYPDSAAVVMGTSHVFVATVSNRGVSARTVLAYSQSADTTSPYFSDQTLSFSRERLLKDRVS